MGFARGVLSAGVPLLHRIDVYLGRLEQASQAIAAVQPHSDAPAGNRRLHENVGEALLGRLNRLTSDLRDRRQKLVEESATGSVWSALNAKACSQLLDEALLYLHAAHTRRQDSHPDLCGILDRLFSEIAAGIPYLDWKSYSLFSTEDSFDKPTDIVRVRYPIAGAWDLPIPVHEFGHFASDKILTKTARGDSEQVVKQYIRAQAVRNAADRGTAWETWLEELFADVFGALTVGPAFGFSSILLRFDPAQPAEERDGKHPTDASRVFAILVALEKLDEPSENHKLEPSIRLVRKYWRDCCEFAGQPDSAEPPETDREKLKTYVFKYYTLLEESAPRVLFRSWRSAVKLKDLLTTSSGPPPPGVRIADLLNAAWLCRIQKPDRGHEINRRFLELCR
jgi:hypothetical protein